MFSIKCGRCGKAIIASKLAGECVACQSRRANGRRLAEEMREIRAYNQEKERRIMRGIIASLEGVTTQEVSEATIDAYIG